MVILGLLAATGFGVRQVRTDPIRYRVAVPPFVDGADYGEAYLMEQLRHSVESTAGPYIGPDPDLRDAVAALNVKGHGPTGQQTSSQVLSSTVSPGQDFTGQAQALVWLCFHSAGWFSRDRVRAAAGALPACHGPLRPWDHPAQEQAGPLSAGRWLHALNSGHMAARRARPDDAFVSVQHAPWPAALLRPSGPSSKPADHPWIRAAAKGCRPLGGSATMLPRATG